MITLIVVPSGTLGMAEELGLRVDTQCLDLDYDDPGDVMRSVMVARQMKLKVFMVTCNPMGITLEMEEALVNAGVGLNKGIDAKMTVSFSGEMLARLQGDHDEANRGTG